MDLQYSRRPPNQRGWTGAATLTVNLSDLQYYHTPRSVELAPLAPLTHKPRDKRCVGAAPPTPRRQVAPPIAVACGTSDVRVCELRPVAPPVTADFDFNIPEVTEADKTELRPRCGIYAWYVFFACRASDAPLSV